MNESMINHTCKLPGGAILKNRIIKTAMSDSLGDGRGNPTREQISLYETWAKGGVAAMIVGEVQHSPYFAEKPGNLVLTEQSDLDAFKQLAQVGKQYDSAMWLQLGHAGAMAFPPTSTPKGPSAIDLPKLTCESLTVAEIEQIPGNFARTASLAQELGFDGVEVHAAHGFLLSQFLSPLFNQRTDRYGGSIDSRMRLLIEVINAVCNATSRPFVTAVKINSSDLLQDGLNESDSTKVIEVLQDTDLDLIEVSGGTYFPGAKSASDGSAKGPYFIDYAKRIRSKTQKPIVLTGGFKSYAQVSQALSEGVTDFAGLARALVLSPDLYNRWINEESFNPEFPYFKSPPEGHITAWYTLKLRDIACNTNTLASMDTNDIIDCYEQYDNSRVALWREHFFNT